MGDNRALLFGEILDDADEHLEIGRAFSSKHPSSRRGIFGDPSTFSFRATGMLIMLRTPRNEMPELFEAEGSNSPLKAITLVWMNVIYV